MRLSFKVTGLKEFQEKLRAMPQDIARNALRAGVAAMAAVVRKEAQRRAPLRSGRLRKAIYQVGSRSESNLYRQVFKIRVRTGVRIVKGKKDRSRDAFYWRWIEFGRGPVRAGRGTRVLADKESGQFFGKEVRGVTPRPFMRPAFEAKKGDAIEALRARIQKRIERFASVGK